MAGRIQNLEIFAAGTWTPGNGSRVTITEQDLDDLVQSFHELSGTNVVKPHLKLGHQDAQKWFGQHTGIPALGWVERVWRQGTKLFADIVNVPDALLDLIRQRRYHNVSVEIIPAGAIKQGDKTFGQVLSAVALLGTEMPAVKNLAGLAAALFSKENQPAAFGEGIVPVTFSSPTPEKGMFTQEQVDSLVQAAVQKAVADTKAEFSAKVTGLETEVKVLTQRAEGAEAKVTEVTEKAAYAEAEKLVDDAIKAGKLLPKQKETALAFATQKTAIKFGGAEKSPAVLFGEFLEAMGPQVKTGEQGKGDGKERDTYATAAAEVDAKTREVMKTDSKLSYADAMGRVLSENAELKARYSSAQ